MIEIMSGFLDYRLDVYHCRRCHRVVRTYEASDESERLAALYAHRSFNCLEPPEALPWDS